MCAVNVFLICGFKSVVLGDFMSFYVTNPGRKQVFYLVFSVDIV